MGVSLYCAAAGDFVSKYWSLAALLTLISIPLNSFSQDQRDGSMEVGMLGAITRSPKAVSVPPEIASILPKKATVRGILHTHLTTAGEDLLVYETPFLEQGQPVCCTFNYSVLAIRDGKLVTDLKDDVGGDEVSLLAYAR